MGSAAVQDAGGGDLGAQQALCAARADALSDGSIDLGRGRHMTFVSHDPVPLRQVFGGYFA